MKFVFTSLIMFMVFGNSFAQKLAVDTIFAARVSEAPIIDGMPNEPVWLQAAALSDFTQRELQEGAAPTESTAVRIVYDNDYLYVAAWCFDSNPEGIIANGLEREFAYWTDDNFEVIIDTYHDKQNGFLFVTNANGAQADILISDDGNGYNDEWEGLWEVQSVRNDAGWFAEFRIPFSTLRFEDNNGSPQLWGINFERNVRRKREQIQWKAWHRNHHLEQVSQAGTLAGIEGIQHKTAVFFKPFFNIGYQKEYPPFRDDAFALTKAGFDIKYPITSTLTLDLTANTDFAQVESDQEQINLTRFPLFFPEKREFFLEGEGIFATKFGEFIEPFYSRRIGINKKRKLVPIIAGARLTGKFDNTTIGFLSMQTGEFDGDPSVNYSVARVRQDVLESSYIGLMVTNKESSDSYNRVAVVDGVYNIPDFIGTNTLQIGGAFAASFSPNTKYQNIAYRFVVDYPNDAVNHYFSVASALNNFNPEIGFLLRRDFIVYDWSLMFHLRPKGLGLQYIELKPFDFEYYTSPGGAFQTLYYQGCPLGILTESGESIECNIMRSGDLLTEDFSIREDVAIPAGEYWWTNYSVELLTNESRQVYGWAWVSLGDYYNGSLTETEFGAEWKFNKHFALSAEYQYNSADISRVVFSTHQTAMRATVNFSTMLSSSIFAQWNSEDDKMNVNFRIHWIPKPGSDVYLVYNQLSDARGHGLRPEISVLQLKVAYLFDFTF